MTRPRRRRESWSAQLVALGHDVRFCPLIAIEPVGPRRRGSTARVGRGHEPERRPRARAAARKSAAAPGRDGPGTAAELEANGRARPLPAVSTQEAARRAAATRGRVLFAGAEGARRLLADELEADVAVLYRTRELRPVSFPDAELVVLASASAAGPTAAWGARRRRCRSARKRPRAEAAGVRVVAEAATHDAAGRVAAVGAGLGSSGCRHVPSDFGLGDDSWYVPRRDQGGSPRTSRYRHTHHIRPEP